MPLLPGKSKKAVSENIKEMMDSGYGQKQAVAASLSNARRHAKRALKMFAGGKVDQDEDMRAVQYKYCGEEPGLELQKFSKGGMVDYDGGLPLEEEADEYEGDASFEKQDRIYYSDGAEEQLDGSGDAPQWNDQYSIRKMFKGGIANKPAMSAKFAKAIKMKRGY